MGIKAVTEYVESLTSSEVEIAWRRIQAEIVLSKGLPSTPSTLDRRVEKLFGEKCITARPMHAYCPTKIGGKNGKPLSQWLKNEVYHAHSLAFLRALKESKWIFRGSPEQSKLIKEMEWGERMFGAFTSDEVGVLRDWIKGLGYSKQKSSGGAYTKFVGGDYTTQLDGNILCSSMALLLFLSSLEFLMVFCRLSQLSERLSAPVCIPSFVSQPYHLNTSSHIRPNFQPPKEWLLSRYFELFTVFRTKMTSVQGWMGSTIPTKIEASTK